MARTTPDTFEGFTTLCAVAAQGMLEQRYGMLTITSTTLLGGVTFSRRSVPVSELVRAVTKFTANAVRQELERQASQPPKGESNGGQADQESASR